MILALLNGAKEEHESVCFFLIHFHTLAPVSTKHVMMVEDLHGEV
jgi:hypothetical protein